MQSFLRILIILILMIGVYIGGWLSSDFAEKDPFLASMLNIKTEHYDQFVKDLSTAIKESAFTDQNFDPQIDPLFVENKEINQTEQNEQTSRETGEQVHESTSTNEDRFDVNEMLTMLAQQLSSKEKMTFALWVRSKFNDQKLNQMTELMKNGMNEKNLIQLYQLTKSDLKANDYEYLLSFLDRYLLYKEETVPTFQNEGDSYGYKSH